jgi:hypothetical protein
MQLCTVMTLALERSLYGISIKKVMFNVITIQMKSKYSKTSIIRTDLRYHINNQHLQKLQIQSNYFTSLL